MWRGSAIDQALSGFAMVGASLRHNQIQFNLIASLKPQLGSAAAPDGIVACTSIKGKGLASVDVEPSLQFIVAAAPLELLDDRAAV